MLALAGGALAGYVAGTVLAVLIDDTSGRSVCVRDVIMITSTTVAGACIGLVYI